MLDDGDETADEWIQSFSTGDNVTEEPVSHIPTVRKKTLGLRYR